MIQNLQHPSLRAKKYHEANDRWQARVNKSWRFDFKIIDETSASNFGAQFPCPRDCVPGSALALFVVSPAHCSLAPRAQ